MRACGCDLKHRLLLSGTKLRKMRSEGEEILKKLSRPEVLDILGEYYESLSADEDVRVEFRLNDN